MPFRTVWAEPETVVEQGGVTVYYTYLCDEIDQGRWEHRFVTEPDDGEDGKSSFDVRNLSTWNDQDQYLSNGVTRKVQDGVDPTRELQRQDAAIEDGILKALRRAIDIGEITAEGHVSRGPTI